MKGDLAQRRRYDQTDILLVKGEGKGKGKDNGKLPEPAVWHQVWRCQGGESQYMWRGPLHESYKSAAQAVAQAVAADEAAKAVAAEASAAGASREKERWRTWTGWRC